MIRINLLPVRQAKKKEMGRQQLVLFAGLIVLALGLNGFWWWSVTTELSRKKSQVVKLQNDIKQLERIIGEVNTIKQDKKALEDKLAVLAGLRNGRTGPVRVLDALASILPKKVWLKDLTEKDGNVVLRGGALTNEDLADFMRELKQSRYFGEASLKKSVQHDDKASSTKYIEFELSCKVRYAA